MDYSWWLLVELFVGGLAVNAIVEIWNRGSIFANQKQKVMNAYAAADDNTWTARWYELWLCPFCLSFWVALAVFTVGVIGTVIELPLNLVNWIFALARISNLIHDLTRGRSTEPEHEGPSHEQEEEESLDIIVKGDGSYNGPIFSGQLQPDETIQPTVSEQGFRLDPGENDRNF